MGSHNTGLALLVIDTDNSIPQSWTSTFGSERSERVASEVEGLALVLQHSFDVVLLSRSAVKNTLKEIERICSEDVTPSVLVGQSCDAATVAILSTDSLDGFVDSDWPDAAVAAYLASVVQRVRAGRNVVAVQRRILDAAQGEIDNLRLQEELAQRTREVLEMQDVLVHSQRIAAIVQLGAAFAHEIINPLTVILGSAQTRRVALGRDGDPAVIESFRDIESEARRIRDIVDRIRRVSKFDTRSQVDGVDVNDLVAGALASIAQRISDTGIATDCTFGDDLPAVTGSRVELEQALLHLLENACTAMPDGGELEVTTSTVDNKLVKIVFGDTGRGIAKEDLDRIFDPFFTTKENWRALGLGLTVAFRIIESHSGKLKVDSQPGRGTSITVLLPAVIDPTRLS